MNFEEPKQKIPQNQPYYEAERVDQEARQKAENFVRPRIHELLQRATEESDKKRFVVDQIATFGKRFFEGKENILDAALAKIEVVPYTNDEEFEEILVRELAGAVLAFIASSSFSEQEAKIYFRGFMLKRMDFTQLDKDGVFSYSRFEDLIDLHITEGLTPQLFLEAMSTLAQVVRSDESVKIIKMTSWVVAKHKRLVKEYGFTINELSESEIAEIRSQLSPEMRDKPLAEAQMTREDFLEKFGRR